MKAKRPYTGGELNELNGKMGISSPRNSIPLMKLMAYHRPKTPEELEQLIEQHQNPGCPCGLISKGTVEDFGKNLYNAQLDYWGEYKYSLQQCLDWEYDLFIGHSFKGIDMEDKVFSYIRRALTDPYMIYHADQETDEEFRVDLEIFYNDILIAGVQVKPESYKWARQTAKAYNKNANQRYGKPVFYAYYDYKDETLLNVDDVVLDVVRIGNKIIMKRN